jgi:hypothetical protein
VSACVIAAAIAAVVLTLASACAHERDETAEQREALVSAFGPMGLDPFEKLKQHGVNREDWSLFSRVIGELRSSTMLGKQIDEPHVSLLKIGP